MPIEKVATIIPVDDVRAAASDWSRILGCEPTFVDAPRWAQFDVAGSRIALAGTDRVSDNGGVMIKVDDLDSRRSELTLRGVRPAEIRNGPHERRFTLKVGHGHVVFYQPL